MGQETSLAIPDHVGRLLRMFETKSVFDRLAEMSLDLEDLEKEVMDHRDVISSAETVMETIEAKTRVAGLEGKNEGEREAHLRLACQNDALYMRALSEIDKHRSQIGRTTAEADRLKRSYKACILEIEARISSKVLVAAVWAPGKNKE